MLVIWIRILLWIRIQILVFSHIHIHIQIRSRTDGPEQVMDVLPDYEDETGYVFVSEHEEAECKEESVNLGASYRQCRAGREAKTIQDDAYISHTTEIKKEMADVVGSIDTTLDKDIEKCFHGARVDQWRYNCAPVNVLLLRPSRTEVNYITCQREHCVGKEGDRPCHAPSPARIKPLLMHGYYIDRSTLLRLISLCC